MGDFSHCGHPERTPSRPVSANIKELRDSIWMVALIPSPVKLLHETRVRTEGMDAGMTQADLQRSKGFKTANGDIVRKAGAINASHDST